MSTRVAIIQCILFLTGRFGDVRVVTTIFELLDDLPFFARGKQVGARAIERDTPLRHDGDLRDDRSVQER